MELMTVSEYAKKAGVSVQSIYKRISRGNLEAEEKDGIKYVKVYSKLDNQSKVEENESQCKAIIKEYKLIIKELKKQIKSLKKDKDQNYERLEGLFKILMEQKAGALPSEITDAVVLDSKKKKKKKKKKI